MEVYLYILRLIHIVSAIFWVGTTLFNTFFLGPTVQSLGADGGRFMQRLLSGTPFLNVITAAAVLTVLSGILLYGPVTSNDVGIMFDARLPLTLGAIAGLISGGLGGAIGGASRRLLALGQTIAAQGTPPTAEQGATLAALQGKIGRYSRLASVLMILAVIGMTWRL